MKRLDRLTFVHVDASAIGPGFDAIVDRPYDEIYGYSGGVVHINEYALYKIEGDRVVDRVGWFPRKAMTVLTAQDKHKASKMVKQYTN